MQQVFKQPIEGNFHKQEQWGLEHMLELGQHMEWELPHTSHQQHIQTEHQGHCR